MANPSHDRSQDEVNEIMAGMERATAEYMQWLDEIAPRCHFTPMQLDGEGGEEWWECAHCGHTKEA